MSMIRMPQSPRPEVLRLELNAHRKVRKGRELEFENLEIKVLDTKDGMAARLELQIKSLNDDDELLD